MTAGMAAKSKERRNDDQSFLNMATCHNVKVSQLILPHLFFITTLFIF